MYAYKVPHWVIEKAGGLHRFDTGSEILISQEIWEEAADEIEFLGKTMDQKDLWDKVDSSYYSAKQKKGRRGKHNKPGEVWIDGIAGHPNAEDIIKMLTTKEKRQLMTQLEDRYPEALRGEPFEVEWTKPESGERKGYRKDFLRGEKRITKSHQELLDLLKKHMKESFIRGYIREVAASSKPAGGDCYEASGKYMMDNCMFGSCELTLVHGEVMGQGPLEGVTYGHAWVLSGDTVIDVSNGGNLQLPKSVYYAVGQIDNIGNIVEYTWGEARKKIMDYEHWGPWDLTTKSGL